MKTAPSSPPNNPAFEPLLRQIADAIAAGGQPAGLKLVERAIREHDDRCMNERALIRWMSAIKVNAMELGAFRDYLGRRELELSPEDEWR